MLDFVFIANQLPSLCCSNCSFPGNGLCCFLSLWKDKKKWSPRGTVGGFGYGFEMVKRLAFDGECEFSSS